MAKAYTPLFSITPGIIRLIAEINQHLGRLSVQDEKRQLKLRRINRIRTVQGSLAIEGNTLSEAQITAILEGKRVIAPPKEILEARNALLAYEQFERWQPDNEKHLLFAHQLLMTGLVDDAGLYRQGNVGVTNGTQVVHMAPPASRVPQLMADLLGWLKTTEQHPLIASCVFHYEFEFIHPFSDGNGRMGRLWQTLILSRWFPLLAQLPVESMIHASQSQYYQAINQSTKQSDCAAFIEFMLTVINNTLQENDKHLHQDNAFYQVSPQDNPQVSPQVGQLLALLTEGPLGRDQLQQLLQLKDRKSFSARYLKPALQAGLIEMTLADKPNSRLQQYRLKPR
ncbi:MAG: Fic family protein [Gammaproteobacteria bacterium]|nr:Fic family protein [Gammaproteobacteria bacterium]